MHFQKILQISIPVTLFLIFISIVSGESTNDLRNVNKVQKVARFRVIEEPRADLLLNIPKGDVDTQVLHAEPRFVGGKVRRRNHDKPSKPSRLGEPSPPQTPSRRQDASPGLNVTNVSPVELSLGGLTGLQGLPPLSLVQAVKLLVAVSPFIIPLIFVPILIFTVGMFMLPVTKPSFFVGPAEALPRRFSRSPLSWTQNVTPAFTNIARSFVQHEECIERVVCEIGKRYIPEEDEGVRTNYKHSVNYRGILGRIMDHFNHPLMQRISRSLNIPSKSCTARKCSFVSFVRKMLPAN